MGPIASAAVRSAIATAGVFVLFVVASFAQMNPGDAHRLSAALGLAKSPTTLSSAGIGWLAFSAWLLLEGGKPPKASPAALLRIGWAVITTLVVSAGIVALFEGVHAALHGPNIVYYLGNPWPYLLGLFIAALFAVAIVRIALPLLPRFDRMQPRNV